MPREVAEVLESAKSLARGQIADLVYELLRVLDGDELEIDQANVDAAWRADIESGKVHLLSHEETVAQTRAMLVAQRSDIRS